MKDSEFERRFLEFVYRTDLVITPSALAYYVDIPIAEAEGHITKLVTREVLKMDITANGEILYSFPSRERVAPAAEKAIPLVSVASPGFGMVPSRPTTAVGPDEKTTCPFCGESVLAVAKKCKHCNEILDPSLRAVGGPLQVNVGLSPSLYRPRLSSSVAALLSVWPGAGHLYCGEVGAGLGWMMATFVGYVAFLVPGIILHICCIIAASNTAKRAT